MTGWVDRLLRPVGADRLDAATSRWAASTRRLEVQARALRRDLHCGDPLAFANMIIARASSSWMLVLRHVGLTAPNPTLPADMTALLAEIERKEVE